MTDNLAPLKDALSDESLPSSGERLKKWLILLLKTGLLVTAFYIVYVNADVPRILFHLEHTAWWGIVGCFLILNIAQVVSTERMRYYYARGGLTLSFLFSLAIYYVGMLFNTVLPGGIGGDGYKIFLVAKYKQFSKMHSLRLMLSNRASGLFMLIALTLFMMCFSETLQAIPYFPVLLLGAFIILIIGYFVSIRLLLKETSSVAIGAMKYSFLVQGLCVVSAWVLLAAMENTVMTQGTMLDYLILFLVSSVVSVLPISIGGAGLRELSFLYGAQYLGLDVELGIAFSLIYFVINVFLSLLGVPFLYSLRKVYDITHTNEGGQNGRTGNTTS